MGRAPDAGCSGTPEPTARPTAVKSPPTYQAPPAYAMALTAALNERSPSGKPSLRETTNDPSADSTGATPSSLRTRKK